jgi:hypothetical protein
MVSIDFLRLAFAPRRMTRRRTIYPEAWKHGEGCFTHRSVLGSPLESVPRYIRGIGTSGLPTQTI